MMDRQKIIDKISKCMRLSESCNPNEAGSALRQARRLMEKYDVSEEQIHAMQMEEASAAKGQHFNPPFWALALSDIVAKAFDCQVLIARRFGKQPEYRFIGVSCAPSVASYTFTVLFRKLEQARAAFLIPGEDLSEDECNRRRDVFAQAWLFRVASKVREFVADNKVREAVDNYVKEKYGDTDDLIQDPVDTDHGDFEDILSGMRAAEEVALYRSMSELLVPRQLPSAVASS
jgi:hypothetical protein